MKEVIEQILEAEKQARERVASARKEAAVILEQAREKALKLEAEAVKTCQRKARNMVKQAEVRAEKEKEAILGQESGTRDPDPREADDLTDRLFRLVLRGDHSEG